MSPSRSVDELRQVGVARVRLGDQVEEVERATAGGSRQVGDDGRHDASSRTGDHDHRVGTEGARRVRRRRRPFLEADGETNRARAADLDDAGVAERLATRASATSVGPASTSTSRTFTTAAGRSLASAFVKPLTAPAMALRAPGFVVAMGATVAGGAHQERTRLVQAVIDRTAGGGEQLDPRVQTFVPLLDVELGERRLVVEGGEGIQAVRSVHRPASPSSCAATVLIVGG